MKNFNCISFRGLGKSLAATVLASATVLGAMLPHNALALDITRLSGGICQPYFGSQASDFDAYPTGIRNRSSSPRWVTCPLAIPDGNSSTTYVYVNLYNVAHSVNALCAAYAYDGAGNYITGSTDSSIPIGNGTAYTTLSSGDGFMAAMCLLTPGSRVRSIVVYN